jgi:hypothetical protein
MQFAQGSLEIRRKRKQCKGRDVIHRFVEMIERGAKYSVANTGDAKMRKMATARR